MAEFDVPQTEDAEQAEEVYEATATFVEEQRGPVKREPRISSITYYDETSGETHDVSIGERVPRIRQPAVAIYESDAESRDVYYICTPHRGVVEGIPVTVAKDDVEGTEYFDEESY